jgi:hypothetical protein
MPLAYITENISVHQEGEGNALVAEGRKMLIAWKLITHAFYLEHECLPPLLSFFRASP